MMIAGHLARPLVIVALALFVAPELEAGSLAPDPMLATIQNIRFTIAGGEFEPIPELDIKALKAEMEERCERALHTAGFTTGASEDAYLSVTLRHAWHGATRDKVAILLELALWVPAKPIESTSATAGQRARSLAIWKRQRLDLVQSSEAAEVILEGLGLALEDLVQSTRAARNHALEPS